MKTYIKIDWKGMKADSKKARVATTNATGSIVYKTGTAIAKLGWKISDDQAKSKLKDWTLKHNNNLLG